MTDGPVYSGRLWREADGTLRGVLTDCWGWQLQLFGTRAADGGYTLSATVDSAPALLRVPAIDDEAAA